MLVTTLLILLVHMGCCLHVHEATCGYRYAYTSELMDIRANLLWVANIMMTHTGEHKIC